MANDRAGRPVPLREVIAAIGAGCCAVTLTGPAVASAASVSKVDLVCQVSAQFDFSPPLSFNTTTAILRGLISSCASPSGRYPRLKSGVVFAGAPVVATGCSPAPLTISGPGTTLFWNDGSTSRFDIDVSTNPTSGALGLASTVTSGTLRGARVSAVPVVVAQRGLCLLGGVRSLTVGYAVITVTNAAPARAARGNVDRRRLRGRR